MLEFFLRVAGERSETPCEIQVDPVWRRLTHEVARKEASSTDNPREVAVLHAASANQNQFTAHVTKMAAGGRRGPKTQKGKASAAAKKKKEDPQKEFQPTTGEKTPGDVAGGVQVIEDKEQEHGDSREVQTGVPVPGESVVQVTDESGGQTAGQEPGNEDEVNDIGDLDRAIEEELGEVSNEEDDGDTGGDLWTPKKEDKLIDFFEKCVFLYDKDKDDYRLRNKKTRAYTVFANKLGVTCK